MMTDDTIYYLLLSLAANMFFFAAVFLQHRHIERVCKQNCALTRQLGFWKRMYGGMDYHEYDRLD